MWLAIELAVLHPTLERKSLGNCNMKAQFYTPSFNTVHKSDHKANSLI